MALTGIARPRWRVPSVLAALAVTAGPGCVLSGSPGPTLAPSIAEAGSLAEGAGLWLERGGGPNEAAEALLARLRAAEADGLDPSRYDLAAIEAALAEARDGGRRDRVEAARLLSAAYLRFARDMGAPRPENALKVVDRSAAPAHADAERLVELAAAQDRAAALSRTLRRHPIYEDLKRALKAERERHAPDAATERLLLANLDRARALPADPGPLYVVADITSAEVTVFRNGVETVSMRAIVGEPRYPTPSLAGAIRYAIFQPYWNVPEDLAQTRVAPAVLKQGPAYLQARNMEVLSDWTPGARPVDPVVVDWRSAAARRLSVRVRQRPGPGNMMGSVKFMLPNDLGIFLHDTPERHLFARTERALSAGCVRVEKPEALAEALFAGTPPAVPAGAAEHAVDLPRPVPVYLIYLTAVARPDGTIERRPDVYGRDG